MGRVKSHLSRVIAKEERMPGSLIGFSFSDAEGTFATILGQEDFGTNHLNKDGHLITEDSVFPTTAPGGAPKRNRCYQDARYLFISPPLRPASFARSARLALLTTLRPRWGLALFDGLGSSRKVSR